MAEEKAKVKKISSAKKRDKQSLKKRGANRSFKAKVGTAVRAYEASLQNADKVDAKAKLSAVYSLMDKGVKTGKFKLNKAARTKSRLSSRLAV